MIVYGGLKKFRGDIRVADVFQGLFIYETISGRFHKPSKANNNKLPFRRNHIAVMVNNDMFTHGGSDENGVLHDTSYSFCTKSYIWIGPLITEIRKPKIPVSYNFGRKSKIKIDINSLEYKIQNLRTSPLIVDRSPGKVSHHSACLVMHKSSNSGIKPVSLNDRDSQKVPPPSVIQYEGVYIFGGKDKQGEVQGNLFVMTIGTTTNNFINLQKYIDKESPSPSARYGHSMHY